MNKKTVKIWACSVLAAACMTSAVAWNSGELGGIKLMSVAAPSAPSAPAANAFTKSAKHKFTKIKKSIANYKAYNKDITGWLIVPGTNINEPVTFSNKSNNYYLLRDWTGTDHPDITYKNWHQRPATATYLDYRSAIGETWHKGTSRNLVLYGHNWNNLKESNLVIGNHEGYTMFSQLPSYTNKEFALKNPYIYFSSADREGIWKIFSVAYVELSTNFPYNSPNPTKAYFGELLKDLKLRSLHDFDTEVNENDRIITLSTCIRQFEVGDEQRFIVVARLLREGESDKDPVKIVDDKKFKHPQFKK